MCLYLHSELFVPPGANKTRHSIKTSLVQKAGLLCLNNNDTWKTWYLVHAYDGVTSDIEVTWIWSQRKSRWKRERGQQRKKNQSSKSALLRQAKNRDIKQTASSSQLQSLRFQTHQLSSSWPIPIPPRRGSDKLNSSGSIKVKAQNKP